MEDAERCIEIAEVAILEGNIKKAQRMLLKAERMHPTEAGKQLLEQIKSLTVNDEEDEYEDRNYIIEAEKYITIARIAMEINNIQKAEMLLTTSISYHPLDEAEELLKILRKNRDGNKQTGPTVTLETDAPPPEKKNQVTDEQIKEIERVKQAIDDYDILGIKKPSTLKEVKTTCARLTRILHPDRNKAPGAKEAFMTVKEASNRLQRILK